jgi:hypothetical protein
MRYPLSLLRPMAGAVAIAAAVTMFLAEAPVAHAQWRGGGAGWHGGWGWHGRWGWRPGGWGCCWRGGVFVGVPPVFVPPRVYYAPPPVYYVPPPIYYSPYVPGY